MMFKPIRFYLCIAAAGLLTTAGCDMMSKDDTSPRATDRPMQRTEPTQDSASGYRMDHPTQGKIDISAESMESAASSGSPFIGRPAPAFSMPDQNGKPVTLQSLQGQWVVMYFYPKDDTPGCACQATEFTQLLTEFEGANAAIYGVSPDSPASHRKFIEKYNLKIDLLSDEDHDVMKKYGAWTENQLGGKTYGRVIRSTFLIGPKGVVRYHWPEVIPEGHAERVMQKLKELRG